MQVRQQIGVAFQTAISRGISLQFAAVTAGDATIGGKFTAPASNRSSAIVPLKG